MSKHSDNRNIRVMQFLDAYEKQESLWNPALESYKNKIARDEAYMQIIKELNTPTLTIGDIKLKVKSIRTTYTKELRMLTKHKDEGKPYSPKLFWFNRANAFLKSVSLSREKRNSLDKNATHDDEEPEDYKAPVDCMISYINGIPGAATIQRRSIGIVDELEPEDADEMLVEKVPQELEMSTVHGCITVSTTAVGTMPPNNHSSSHHHHHDDHDTGGGGGGGGCNIMTTDDNDDNETTLLARPLLKASKIEATNELQNYCNNSHNNHSNNTTTTTNNVQSNETTLTMETSANHHSLLINNATTATTTTDNSGGDECDHFCRSVAAQLRRITDSYSRAVAKLKIQQILFEAETGHYRSNPTITIPVSQHINHM